MRETGSSQGCVVQTNSNGYRCSIDGTFAHTSIGAVAVLLATMTFPACASANQPVASSQMVSLSAAAETSEDNGDARRAIPIRLELDGLFSGSRGVPSHGGSKQSDNAISLGYDYFQLRDSCKAYVWWRRARRYGTAVAFWPDAEATAGKLRRSFVSYGALLGNQSASPLSGDNVADGFRSRLLSGLRAAAEGDDAAAERDFREAAQVNPFSSWPQLFAGDLALAKGHTDEARRRFIGIVREAWPHYAGSDFVAVEMLDAYPPASCAPVIRRPR